MPVSLLFPLFLRDRFPSELTRLSRVVRSADPTTLLTKRQSPTSLPLSSKPSSSINPSSSSSQSKKGKSKASLSAYSDEVLAAQQKELDLLELSESASQHRLALSQELSARQERLLQLKRATRELELQKIMMSSGARKEVIQNKGGDRGKREEEWWLKGGKPGKNGKKGNEDEERAGLPNAQEGIATGARVWVSLVLSYFFHCFLPGHCAVSRFWVADPRYIISRLVTEIQGYEKEIGVFDPTRRLLFASPAPFPLLAGHSCLVPPPPRFLSVVIIPVVPTNHN